MSTPVVKALRAANVAFYTAIETGNLDLMEDVWLDGPRGAGTYCVHPTGPPIFGRPEVLRSFAMLMANTPYIQFILTDVHVSVGAETGLVSCIENVLTSGTDSGAVFASNRSVATKVFVHTDDGWRLWAHHASPILDHGTLRDEDE